MSTAEELNQIFPKGCDIVGIATPGIVCEFFSSFFSIYLPMEKINK